MMMFFMMKTATATTIMVAIMVVVSYHSAYSTLQQLMDIVKSTRVVVDNLNSNMLKQQQQQQATAITAQLSTAAALASLEITISKKNNKSFDAKTTTKTSGDSGTAAVVSAVAEAATSTKREEEERREIRTIHNMDSYPITSSCVAPPAPTNTEPRTPATKIQTTLVLQLSQDRSWILKHHCQRWKNDPIVAVIVGSNTNKETRTSNPLSTIENEYSSSCPQLKIIPYELNGNETRPEQYPINKLRNIGLDAVTTSHVLVADVDFLPSLHLDVTIQQSLLEREQQRQLLASQQQQQQQQGNIHDDDDDDVALVVPAFEKLPTPRKDGGDGITDAEVELVPKTFEQLRDCVQNQETNKKCDVFHRTRYPDGHSTTKSDEWLNKRWYEIDFSDVTQSTTTIEYIKQSNMLQRLRQPKSIKCFDSSGYEPYSVIRWCPTTASTAKEDGTTTTTTTTTTTSNSRRTQDTMVKPIGPYFDERFIGFGLNKISHVSLLRYRKYQFKVLPGGGFLCHYPHAVSKSRQSFVRNTNALFTRMVKLYKEFKIDLETMYNNNTSTTTPTTEGGVSGRSSSKQILPVCTHKKKESIAMADM